MASSTFKITLVTVTGAALCGLLACAIKRYFQGAGGGSGHVADPQGAGRPVPLEEEKKRSIRPDSEQAQDIANHVADVPTLWTNPDYKGSPNPMVAPSGFVPRESCIPRGAFTLGDRQYRTVDELMHAERFKKAGPKEQLYFDPSEVRAAVVTCGGLCPGENVVIRELVMMLWYGYKVRSIYGVKYGFEGFWKNTAEGDCYVDLVPDLFPGMENRVRVLPVKDIHNTGGTVLGSSRGGFDGEKIVDALQRRGINQVYAIGGDGTHRGLLALSKIIRARGLQIALIGIPKTIDNDMPLLDKTFGFSSAVEMAVTAIQCADVEANGAEYGIGLVKVMGRNAGHIAMHAALANRDVNVCLIPEFPFDVYGPKGLFEYVVSRLRNRHHCVIVVSEGAGCGMRDVRLADLERRDNSGNRIPPDIGTFLRDELPKYARETHHMDVTLKYIDPSYMLRAIPANSSDRYMCAVLAEYAVHAAMAGYTDCTVGIMRSYSALIPLTRIVTADQNTVKFNDRNWQRLLQSTGQPPFLNTGIDNPN